MTVTNDEQVRDEAAEMAGEAEDTAGMVGEPTPSSLEEQLAAARAEAARNLDGWQRTQAEFANARKRFEKQRIEVFTSVNADLVVKLLPLSTISSAPWPAPRIASRTTPGWRA